METTNKTAYLILKLSALIIIIWGMGWLIYENTKLFNGFTQASYQNMLLVIMGASWLIILLMQIEKTEPYKLTSIQPKNASSLYSPKKHIKQNVNHHKRANPCSSVIDIKKLIKEFDDKK